MDNNAQIVVLYGGVGSEREVSLKSGEAIGSALAKSFNVELMRLDDEAVPAAIRPGEQVVFPALHGSFGEDGRLQALLEAAGIEYCGSDAAASRLCMAKDETKALAASNGVTVPKALAFEAASIPLADAVIAQLGADLVVKPTDQGSSVGLFFTENRSALGQVLGSIDGGRWLIEERIRGRELTVGLLEGKAMGIVEIVSASGVYDYEAKYTAGRTEYRFPAKLDAAVEQRIKAAAETIFGACGCRDFARVDFLLAAETPYFLEVNTLPGLTATSLLPKSASCEGHDFEMLAAKLVSPALQRFAKRKEGQA